MKGYQLRIALKELPTVWRRVLVPGGITFLTLHQVIQYAMGWQDYHLHEFSSDDDPTIYTDNSEAVEEYDYYLKNPEKTPDQFTRWVLETPMKSSDSVKIDSILQRSSKLTYVYDLGDHWEHEVVLEEVVDLEHAFPVCIGAGEACPPEDAGGPWGYMDFLEAWHDPGHEDHQNCVMWGTMQGYTGRFDLERVNQTLRWKLPLGKSRVDMYAREVTGLVFGSTIPMAFKTQMPGAALAETHKLRYFLDFLNVIRDRGPLKATAKGNLPAKLVMELYGRGYDFLNAVPYPHVRKEEDAWFLSHLHELARSAGFVVKRKGQILLSKKGLAVLEAPLEEAYLGLWWILMHQYRELYYERYGAIHPFYIGHLLSLIQRCGGSEREISFYCDRLLEYFPDLVDDYLQRYESEDQAKRAFSGFVFTRIIRRCLEELGLVETREVKGSTYWETEYLLRRTELMDQVFAVW